VRPTQYAQTEPCLKQEHYESWQLVSHLISHKSKIMQNIMFWYALMFHRVELKIMNIIILKMY